MIEFTERTIGVWYVQLVDGPYGCDYLGSLWRTDNGGLEAQYRFRYYEGDQSLQFEESQDRKSWYSLKLSSGPGEGLSEEKAIKTMRSMAEVLWKKSGGKRYEVMMDHDGMNVFLERFREMPFVTLREERS